MKVNEIESTYTFSDEKTQYWWMKYIHKDQLFRICEIIRQYSLSRCVTEKPISFLRFVKAENINVYSTYKMQTSTEKEMKIFVYAF